MNNWLEFGDDNKLALCERHCVLNRLFIQQFVHVNKKMELRITGPLSWNALGL